MKKRYVLIVILLLFTFLATSCHDAGGTYYNERVVHRHVEAILQDISKKDKKALRKEFSRKALKEDKNFEKGEEYLFDFYQGEIKSWRVDTISVSESDHESGKSVKAYVSETIQTDKEAYNLFISYYTMNEPDNDDTGVYELRLIKTKDLEKYSGDTSETPGIDIPNDYKYKSQ